MKTLYLSKTFLQTMLNFQASLSESLKLRKKMLQQHNLQQQTTKTSLNRISKISLVSNAISRTTSSTTNLATTITTSLGTIRMQKQITLQHHIKRESRLKSHTISKEFYQEQVY